MSGGKAEGERLDGRAWWEGGGRYERRDCGRIGVDGEKVTVDRLEFWTGESSGKADLCNEETFDDRPPKDDAMVLNSTCLISGLAAG